MQRIEKNKGEELRAKLVSFLREPKTYKQLVKAADSELPMVVEFSQLDKKNPELGEYLLNWPDPFFELAEEAVNQIDLPGPVRIQFRGLPENKTVMIRNLRSEQIGKFISVEGIVRKSSEIRPEITSVVWECPCGESITMERQGTFIGKPQQCPNCKNRSGFKQVSKQLVDTRWIVIEEPFELTEGERPSQLTILLTKELTSPDGRRMTDPGNRLKITGVLKDIPKGKFYSVKLDFFFDANHMESTDIGWEKMEITKKDIEEIEILAKDPKIYENLVASLAPSIYGMKEIKESIILQLFGGVRHTLRDGTNFRGNVHILLVGDPASGKSQILKLVPTMMPRGRYVSGKGVTTAGLCMSYDTMVPTIHGEIRKIGDIVEESLKGGKEKIKGGWASGNGSLEILCLSTDGFKIKRKNVSKFFKLKPKGKLTKLVTQSGREIKLTRENPILTIENGILTWKQAHEIMPDEHIAIARSLPLNSLPVGMQPEFARFAGMVAGDGDVGSREVRFHNMNEDYLNRFKELGSGLGFNPRKYYQKTRVPCVRVASKDLCDKLEGLGIPRGVKSDNIVIPQEVLKSNELLAEFISGLFNCDGGFVERKNGSSYIEYTTTSRVLAKQLQTSLLRFGISSKLRERSPSKKGFGGKKQKYVIAIRGLEHIHRFHGYIGFDSEKAIKTKRYLEKTKNINTNIDIIPNIGEKVSEIRKGLGIRIKNNPNLYCMRHYEHGRRRFTRGMLLKFVKELKKIKGHPYFDFLEDLAKSDMTWDKVVKKEEVKEDWVYDLTVSGEHNFVANDFIVHNTATVTKDEQFMGGWVLEAGAMVLANKGLLSVDEFEKMSPDDHVAMHEAMEQGTVSIAKASIVTTLPAQTSVLAGGNPKLSRFDPYLSISKQITISDTLLSRFDLKFILKDKPNPETDQKIVDHIMSSREEDYMAASPKLPPELIKKYIAYTRENYSPVHTRETGKILKKFYVDSRKKAIRTNAPIPITLRQFEALMRLSEASAKIQLQTVVRKVDVERAIRLMQHSLVQLGYDPDTGLIDIDKAEGLTTSRERSHIKIILDIIETLSENKKEVPADDIVDLAKKDGISEIEAKDIIERLRREGILFEPNPKHVQKV